MSAVMLAEQMKKVYKALKLDENTSMLAFSDSQITLAWIRGEEDRWGIFVANRVRKINDLLPNEIWHYVDTKANPVDLVSRGMTAEALVGNELWFNGPGFIHQEVIEFDARDVIELPSEHKVINAIVRYESSTIERLDMISSWKKTLRVIHYALVGLQKLLNRWTVEEKIVIQHKMLNGLKLCNFGSAEQFIVRLY